MSIRDRRRIGERTEHESFEERYKGTRGIFQVLPQEKGSGPAKCSICVNQP